jgi:hypothetical protein
MNNALISPNETVSYVSSWNGYTPVYTTVPNGQRVAEVSSSQFPVAPPMFWMVCADDVVADLFYYDSVTNTIQQTPPSVARVNPDQPISTGTQTL